MSGWDVGENTGTVHNQHTSVNSFSETTKMRQFMILLVNHNSALELGVLMVLFCLGFLKRINFFSHFL